ncbi:MAG: peptide ABC transporter substrate-binding protein [Candidatus Eremiobacteraeota bacterium]|nr:peptide ABC transporter substrate-binding protein [Candidatus Eremiobacteraeota bacterium]
MKVAIERLLAAGIACSLLAGCTKVGTSPGGGGERHAYTQPHVLRFSSAEDIVGLNPLTVTQAVVDYMAQMTMAWLVRTDTNSEPTVPELITEIPTLANGGVSKDGKTITWHLRKGVTWSDGVEFTADDVVFSTAQVKNPKNNVVSQDGWELIDKVDEPDKYTVVYHLRKPYSSYLVTFFSTASANPAIMPKHILQAYDSLNNVPYNSLPIGIGPFKYQSWKRGDSVTMVPNPTYWRGVPKLQKVVFKIIPDRNTVLEQMRTHELDLWMPVSPHFVPQLKAISGVQVLLNPSYYFDHMDFNMERPVMKDPAVREALRYATDRAALNDKVRNGLYIIQESVVPPASKFHEDLPLVRFDLAKANEILDAAGWVRGADGIRAKNGRRLSLELASSTGSPDTDTELAMMGGWWKQIGADFVVKRYLAAMMFAPAQSGGIMYSGKFDIVFFAWGTDPNMDLTNLYSCDRIPPKGQNDPRYCNAAVTKKLAEAQASYDPAVRTADIKFIQEQIYKDVPTIVLAARKETYAYNTDLKNWHPNAVSPFDDMLLVDI